MTVKLASLALPDGSPSETASIPELEPVKPQKAGWHLWLLSLARKASRTIRQRTRNDWLFATGGIGLAVACALFPWYIFFNQEEFGVRPLKFAGRSDADGIAPASLPELTGVRMLREELDFTATGAISPSRDKAPRIQPFPGDVVDFRLIHAGNGRAMIADKDGYWVVGRGSHLPDGSQVASIEQRDGGWVLVTSHEGVIPLTRE